MELKSTNHLLEQVQFSNLLLTSSQLMTLGESTPNRNITFSRSNLFENSIDSIGCLFKKLRWCCKCNFWSSSFWVRTRIVIFFSSNFRMIEICFQCNITNSFQFENYSKQINLKFSVKKMSTFSTQNISNSLYKRKNVVKDIGMFSTKKENVNFSANDCT